MTVDLEIKIVKTLNDDGWNFMPDGKKGLYVTSYNGENGTYKIYLNCINLRRNLLIFYGYLPVKIKSENLYKTAILINKINRQLQFGNFEVDYGGKKVSFRNGMDFLGEEFTDYMAINAISPCAFTVDKYFPDIKSLAEN